MFKTESNEISDLELFEDEPEIHEETLTVLEARKAVKYRSLQVLRLQEEERKTYCWLAGNEGNRALYIPYKGLYRAPHSPIPY